MMQQRVRAGALAVALIAAGCIDPHCPRGYVKKGDTCYRIRDAGQDAEVDDDGTSEDEVQVPAPTDAHDEEDSSHEELDASHSESPGSSADANTDVGMDPDASDVDSSPTSAECVDSSACPASHPYCVNDACRQCMGDEDCGSAQVECKDNMCIKRCGNGIVERSANEDCDPGVTGWTSANCNILCKETVYTPKATTDCNPDAADTMAGNFFGPGNCPAIPGFTPTCLYIRGAGCYLACNSDANCPTRYRCSLFAGTSFEGWNPPFAGYCQ